jgi:hypothetical protein
VNRERMDDRALRSFSRALRPGCRWQHNSHSGCIATILELKGTWLTYSIHGLRRQTTVDCFFGAFRPVEARKANER